MRCSRHWSSKSVRDPNPPVGLRTSGSLSKYGFQASGVRTRASAHRPETGRLPRFLSSVLNRPSQEVRRELACGERLSGFSAPGQSTGLPQKPQETCHAALCPVRRRVWLVCQLAEEVRPDTNGLQAGALESLRTKTKEEQHTL
jgi:hypothetical protein